MPNVEDLYQDIQSDNSYNTYEDATAAQNLNNKTQQKLDRLNGKNSRLTGLGEHDLTDDKLKDTTTGAIHSSKNKIWNEYGTLDKQALLSDIVDQQIYKKADGSMYQYDNKGNEIPYDGATERFYAYGLKNDPDGVKFGIARGDMPTSDWRYMPGEAAKHGLSTGKNGYGWNPGNVDLDNKLLDILVPKNIAVAGEALIHGNRNAQKHAEYGEGMLPGGSTKYGSGYTEEYDSLEGALGDATNEDTVKDLTHVLSKYIPKKGAADAYEPVVEGYDEALTTLGIDGTETTIAEGTLNTVRAIPGGLMGLATTILKAPKNIGEFVGGDYEVHEDDPWYVKGMKNYVDNLDTIGEYIKYARDEWVDPHREQREKLEKEFGKAWDDNSGITDVTLGLLSAAIDNPAGAIQVAAENFIPSKALASGTLKGGTKLLGSIAKGNGKVATARAGKLTKDNTMFLNAYTAYTADSANRMASKFEDEYGRKPTSEERAAMLGVAATATAIDVIADRFILKGKDTKLVNAVIGKAKGAMTKYTEKLPGTFVKKVLGGVGKTGAVATEDILTEGGTEALQERLQIFGEHLDTRLTDEDKKRIAVAGATGGVSGPGMKAISIGEGYLRSIKDGYGKNKETQKPITDTDTKEYKEDVSKSTYNAVKELGTADTSELTADNIEDYIDTINEYVAAKKTVINDTADKDTQEKALRELSSKYPGLDEFITQNLDSVKKAFAKKAEELERDTRGSSKDSVNYAKVDLAYGLYQVNNDIPIEEIVSVTKLNSEETNEFKSTLEDSLKGGMSNIQHLKNTPLASVVQSNVEHNIEKIEKEDISKSKALHSVVQEVTKRIKKDYKDLPIEEAAIKLRESYDTRGGTTDNVKLKTVLATATTKVGITLDDVLEHVVATGKEDTTPTRVQAIKDQLYKAPGGYYKTAKNKGLKLRTTYQSKLNKYVTNQLNKLAALKNQQIANTDLEKATTIETQIVKIEAELQEKLENNTLFDKEVIIDELAAGIQKSKKSISVDAGTFQGYKVWKNVIDKKFKKFKNKKLVNKNDSTVKVLNALYSLSKENTKGNLHKQAYAIAKKVYNTKGKQPSATQIGAVKKELSKIIKEIRKNIDSKRTKAKDAESLIRILNSGQYSKNAVKNGLLSNLVNALNTTTERKEQVIADTTEDIESKEVTLKSVKEKLGEDPSEGVTVDQKVSAKKAEKAEKVLKTFEAKEDGEVTDTELDEVREAYKVYKAKKQAEEAVIAEVAKELEEIETTKEKLEKRDLVTTTILELTENNNGVLDKSVVTEFVRKVKQALDQISNFVMTEDERATLNAYHKLNDKEEFHNTTEISIDRIKELIAKEEFMKNDFKDAVALAKEFGNDLINTYNGDDTEANEYLIEYLKGKIGVLKGATKVIGIKQELLKVEVKEKDLDTIKKEVATNESRVVTEIAKETEAIAEQVKKLNDIINTAEALLNSADIHGKKKQALVDVIKNAKKKIKDLMKKDAGEFISHLEEDSLDAKLVDSEKSKKSRKYGGESTLQLLVRTKRKLVEIVKVIPTLANSFKFEDNSVANNLVDKVREALEGAFYHAADDVNRLQFISTQASAFQSLFTAEVDEKGDVTNMKLTDNAALAIHAAFADIATSTLGSWVSFHDDKQVRKFFGVAEDTPLSPKQSKVFKKVRKAYPVKFAQSEAGKALAAMLGYKPNKESMSRNEESAMYMQLGHVVLVYAEKQGLIELEGVKLSSAEVVTAKGGTPEDTDKSNKATMNFVSLKKKITPKQLTEVTSNEALKDMADTFNPNRKRNEFTFSPYNRKEKEGYKNTIIGRNVHNTAEEALNEAEHTPYVFNIEAGKDLLEEFDKLETTKEVVTDDNYRFADDLFTYKDKEAAAKFFGKFGVMLPQEISKVSMLYEDRNRGYEAYIALLSTIDKLRETVTEYDSVVKTIEANKETLGIKEVPEVLNMYTKYFVSKNGRFFQDSSLGLTPQAEKEIARWLLLPKEVTEFTPSAVILKKIKTEDSKVLRDIWGTDEANMLIGIAQGFGASMDKEFTLRSMALGAKIFNMSAEELQDIKDRLANSEEIEIEFEIPTVNFLTGKAGNSYTTKVMLGKEHHMQRDVIINSLLKYKAGKTKTLTIPYEIDGITNGTFHKNGSVPIVKDYADNLAKTGLYMEDTSIGGIPLKDFAIKPSSQDFINILAISKDIHIAEGKKDTKKVHELKQMLGGTPVMTEEEVVRYEDAYLSTINKFEHTRFNNDEMVEFAEKNVVKSAMFKELDKGETPKEELEVNSPVVYLKDKTSVMSPYLSKLTIEEKINKLFRDFVKYPKMIFDYGGSIKNIRKAFTHDIVVDTMNTILIEVNEVIENWDDVKLEDHKNLMLLLFNKTYTDNDSVLLRNLENVRDTLNSEDLEGLKVEGYPKTSEGKALTEVEIGSTTYTVNATFKRGNPSLYALITSLVDNTHGYALERALITSSGALIDVNNALNAAGKWMGHIYIYKLEKALGKVRNANKEKFVNAEVSNPTSLQTAPTIAQVEAVIEQLDAQGFTPIVSTPDNSVDSGIELIDSTMQKADSKVVDKTQEGTVQVPYNNGKSTVAKTAGLILKNPAVVGALASVVDTHFLDGTVLAEVLKKHGVTPIHDAFIIGPHQANQVGIDYGEYSLKYMLEHDVLANYANSLANMVNRLTESELTDIVEDNIKEADMLDTPSITQVYTTQVETGGKLVRKVKDELSQHKDKRIEEEDYITLEDLFELMNDYHKVTTQNKKEMASKELYFNQLGGVANGTFVAKAGSRKVKDRSIPMEVTPQAESSTEIEIDKLPIKELPESLLKEEYEAAVIERIGRVLKSSATLTGEDTETNKKYWDKFIELKKQFDSEIKVYSNAYTAIGKYIASGDYVSNGGIPEESTWTYLKDKYKYPSTALDDTYKNFYIKAIEQIIIPALKETSLGSFETWYNTRYKIC